MTIHLYLRRRGRFPVQLDGTIARVPGLACPTCEATPLRVQLRRGSSTSRRDLCRWSAPAQCVDCEGPTGTLHVEMPEPRVGEEEA